MYVYLYLYLCRVLRFSPIVDHFAEGFGKITSLCGLFILSCGVAIQLVLMFFSDGTVPYVADCVLCLWEDMSSGSSYTALLNHFLPSHLNET